MTEKFFNKLLAAHQECTDCPSPQEIVAFFKELSGALFMDYSKNKFTNTFQIEQNLLELQAKFSLLQSRNSKLDHKQIDAYSGRFFKALPKIYDYLQTDLKAIYTGDPAARSSREIIRSYPGFYAILIYRIAHEMHKIGITDIPRILTEYAHSKTGIDIHPGAEIGTHFCIDHGTGIVIGETTIIGKHVKIYQGVTLGALSVDKEDANKKRHPTIEDGVIIYANAAILGGKTIIGKHSVVGGNVWLTRSIPPGTKLYYKANVQDSDKNVTDTFIIKEVHS